MRTISLRKRHFQRNMILETLQGHACASYVQKRFEFSTSGTLLQHALAWPIFWECQEDADCHKEK